MRYSTREKTEESWYHKEDRPAKTGKMQTVFIECKNGSNLAREMLLRVLLTSLVLSAAGPLPVLDTEFDL
jgi:hypothetical protein